MCYTALRVASPRRAVSAGLYAEDCGGTNQRGSLEIRTRLTGALSCDGLTNIMRPEHLVDSPQSPPRIDAARC